MKVVLKACNFIKKRLQQRCFHVNISKVLGAAFYTELWHLLLKINFSMRKDFLLKKKVSEKIAFALTCFIYKYKSLQAGHLPQEHLPFSQHLLNFIIIKIFEARNQ